MDAVELQRESFQLLEGKITVVTGGAAGIGGGISRQFAVHGATVVINDIDETLLEGTIKAIEGAGGRAIGCLGDIRDPSVVRALADTASGVADGRIDVLVNNVGDFRPPSGPFLQSNEATWAAAYEINLLHVLRCTHAIAPAMVARGAGSIISVSTVEAKRGVPNLCLYSAFNAGVDAFTRSLALELAPAGVRVNSIAPDTTDTLQVSTERLLGGGDPRIFSQWVPLGRPGVPRDSGGVAVFLASDLSSYVTGSTICVDGGTMAASGWYRRNDGSWTNMPELAETYKGRPNRTVQKNDS